MTEYIPPNEEATAKGACSEFLIGQMFRFFVDKVFKNFNFGVSTEVGYAL